MLRSIPLWSERYGLRGKADVVELRADGPYPVEHKVGRRRGIHADLQLCAQALCLEEMLGQPRVFVALLPYWMGAWSMKLSPCWMAADFAARIPFIALLVLSLLGTWYAVY